jgi:hypothetical protein
MAAGRDSDWTAIYQTRSSSDADLVRTTLEVAGFRVSIEAADSANPFISTGVPGAVTVSVPTADADDARAFLREKTSLLSSEPSPLPTTDAPPETVEEAAEDILELRQQHNVAACKYCGIPTLDVGELELDSRMIALLRAAGLGVNSSTFSEFQPGERICSECAGHEVTCELCGRVLDAFIDEGEYRRANDDEAYICSPCIARLEDQVQSARDW